MSRVQPQIGTQQQTVIPAGGRDVLFDHRAHEAGELHRIECDGVGFVFELTWGTSVTYKLINIMGPFSCDLPGSCGVIARNISDEERRAKVSVARVSARGPCLLREVIDASAAPVVVQDGAARIINPGVGPVTYDWQAGITTLANDVNVIGRPWPIQSGAIITAGIAIVEYEA